MATDGQLAHRQVGLDMSALHGCARGGACAAVLDGSGGNADSSRAASVQGSTTGSQPMQPWL